MESTSDNKQYSIAAKICMCVFMVAAATIAGLMIIAPKASADPLPSAPQKSHFVEESVNCTGELQEGTGRRFVEFSASTSLPHDAKLVFAEYNGEEWLKVNDPLLFSGVGSNTGFGHGLITVAGVAPGTTGSGVVFTLMDVDPGREFGIFGAWRGGDHYELLFRWTSSQFRACGTPLYLV